MRNLFDIENPTTGIILAQDNVTAKNFSNSYGPGRLFITEECVSWISREQKGFVLSYPEISLHAVCRDLSSFPEECICLMLDCDKSESESDEDMEGENGDHMNGDAQREAVERELFFVPDDKAVLDAMFSALSTGQALHPDPADVDSDEDSEEMEGGTHSGGDLHLGTGDLGLDEAQHDEQFDDEEDDEEPHLGGGDA